MPDIKDLYSIFQQRSIENGWGEFPSWMDMEDVKRDKIGLVLSRLALARAIHTDEPISQLDREAGLWQGTALRLYLFLTCLEMLGRLARDSSYHSYTDWLCARREEIADQRRDACKKAIHEAENSINSCESLTTVLIAVNNAYNSQHGFMTHFRAFFDNCVDSDLINTIVQKCWVFKNCPDLCYAGLHTVQPGYTSAKSASTALAKLAKARAAWDQLDLEKRVRRIADVLANIRNDYTHGLIPTYVPLDKTPWYITENSSIKGSIVSGKISYLSDRKFEKLSVNTHKSGKWFGVQAISHNDLFLVRKSDLANANQEAWLKQVLDRCSIPIDMGDTIYMRHHKVAFATCEMPLTQHLEKWIDNGLKNIILLNE